MLKALGYLFGVYGYLFGGNKYLFGVYVTETYINAAKTPSFLKRLWFYTFQRKSKWFF